MRREATPLRRTLALLGAAWLLVAYVVTTAQAAAMICPEEAVPTAEAAPPPCHGHTPATPNDEPAPRSTECSPFCQLLCHGLAFLGQPTLTAPLVAAPVRSAEAGNQPLPLLPDSIDHVPL